MRCSIVLITLASLALGNPLRPIRRTFQDDDSNSTDPCKCEDGDVIIAQFPQVGSLASISSLSLLLTALQSCILQLEADSKCFESKVAEGKITCPKPTLNEACAAEVTVALAGDSCIPDLEGPPDLQDGPACEGDVENCQFDLHRSQDDLQGPSCEGDPENCASLASRDEDTPPCGPGLTCSLKAADQAEVGGICTPILGQLGDACGANTAPRQPPCGPGLACKETNEHVSDLGGTCQLATGHGPVVTNPTGQNDE